MKKLLVVLLVLGLAVPAMAAEWNFYGSFRTHLGYYEQSEDVPAAAPSPNLDTTIRAAGAGPDDDDGVVLSLSSQSRFGAKIVASDSLYGVMEFGFNEAATNVTLRLAYGVWNFGPGKLMVGKNYTPATFLGYSGMIGDMGAGGEANMLVGALPFLSRQPLIQLQFGTFEFALIENSGTALSAAFSDVDRYIPKIEAAYVFRTPVVAIRPVVGFQTYEVENPATGDSESVDSYLAGLGVSLTLGPAYIKATGAYHQNPGNYGDLNFIAPNNRSATLVGTSVEDATQLAATLAVGAKFSSTIGIEAGMGWTNTEVDTAPGVTREETGMNYYLQAPITLAKGVTVTPEVGYIDYGDQEVTGAADVDLGEVTYFIASFKVDF